jgi:hypothetical protein
MEEATSMRNGRGRPVAAFSISRDPPLHYVNMTLQCITHPQLRLDLPCSSANHQSLSYDFCDSVARRNYCKERTCVINVKLRKILL